MTLAERIWSKVDWSHGGSCWPWVGARHDFGYGVLRVGGMKRLVHRLVYRLMVGTIPDGQHVLHSCGKSWCVNPDHLRLGTHAENMADKVRHGTSLRGERNPMAKLSNAQVDEIRSRRVVRRGDLARLAREFNISDSRVSQIRGKK